MSGNTLTIGVGSSMSEAAKALLYGKMNEKDQIVEYEPQIEDYIGDDSEEESEGEEMSPEELQEAPAEGEGIPPVGEESVPPEAGEGSAERDRFDTDVIEEESEIPEEESGEADAEAMLGDEELQAEDGSEQSSIDGVGDGAYEADEEIIAEEGEIKDPEGNIDENEVIIPAEMEDDEQIKVPSDMTGPEYGEKNDIESDEIESPTDGDIPEENLESDETVNQAMIDGEESEEDEIDELSSEDVASGSLDEGEDEESPEHQELLTDMIHGHMQGEEEGGIPEDQMEGGIGDDSESSDFDPQQLEMGQQVEMEHTDDPDHALEIVRDHLTEDPEYYSKLNEMESGDGQQDVAVDDEIKNDIIESLQAFRENKELLEQAKEANPQLYQATITMLRVMIEMAKKLNFSPEEDIEQSDMQMESEEQLPHAQEMGDEADMEEGGEELPPKKLGQKVNQ